MKPGDKITCESCGQEAFAKKKTEMDGWKKKGEILVCGFCSAKLGDWSDSPKDDQTPKETSMSKLESFLGTKKEDGPKISDDGDDRRFCRDCVHYITHAFLNRCVRHDKEVNPMDDCPDYKRKEPPPSPDKA